MPDPQPEQMVACRQCGLLQQEIALQPQGGAVCCCCGASLYRNTPDSMSRTLALTIAAIICFSLANIYPILGIELQGNYNATNLFGAVRSLWQQGMHPVSALVFATTILTPALEMAILLYLLIPLILMQRPPRVVGIMRLMETIKPWGMIEVFMLGILVSLVKLKSDVTIIPGVALWSFAALTLMLSAVAASFNPRDIWLHLDRIKNNRED
ncbi:MAG: paraquat-inducible protein A [Deltaproteobacteria bacterium RIFOXYD12_FULL_56_24]|nr:MAG: paraquat-inducible protein A [Deltaproteobacteria bacterium RIFOXYD12_FULL_56_24]